MQPNDVMVYVYALIDPRDGSPFYVGQSYNPEKRRREHIVQSLWRDRDWADAKRTRIRAVLDAGMEPAVRVLEMVPWSSVAKAESRHSVALLGRIT